MPHCPRSERSSCGLGRKVLQPVKLQIVGHIIGPPEFVEQAILGNGGRGDRLNHLRSYAFQR